MRRSRLIIALLLEIPGLAILVLDFLGHLGIFWKVLAWVLLGVGGLMISREAKRLQARNPKV
jgi:hypothetical protein